MREENEPSSPTRTRHMKKVQTTHLLDKCAATSINHENIRRLPSQAFSFIVCISGVSLGSIHVGVTKIRVGIVDILCNRSTIGWYTKQRLSMIVSILPEQTVRDLYSMNKKYRARLCQHAMTKHSRGIGHFKLLRTFRPPGCGH
jgi:hypothetical protein